MNSSLPSVTSAPIRKPRQDFFVWWISSAPRRLCSGRGYSADGCLQRHERQQLGDDRDSNERSERAVIQDAEQSAAGEPGRAKQRGKNPVGPRPHALRYELGDRGRHQCVLRAHRRAPKYGPGERRTCASEESQRRRGHAEQDDRTQDDKAAAIEQQSEYQRAGAARAHRNGIEDRNQRPRDDGGLREVERNEREIGEPETEQRRARSIEPEG